MDRERWVASALAAYAQLYGRVERKLFADFSAGEAPASLKKEYLERYGIPARMFNGLRVSLEGQVSAVQKTMGLRLDNLQRRIARAELEIAKAVERGRLNQVHQKRRPGKSEIQVGCAGSRCRRRPGQAVFRLEAVVAEAA